MRLILASTSPRRREILALLGLPFDAIAPEFDETVSAHLSIEDEVLDFAVGKARSVAVHHPEAIVIGSDTMIFLDGAKIGKPLDLADAKRILRSLSGRTHLIYTSVAIIDGGGDGLQMTAKVSVDMRSYNDNVINRYLTCDESMDKAGAYSIQGEGSKLIAAIDGDFLAAVGMPLRPIAEYLRRRHVVLPIDIDELHAQKDFLNWRQFA
ncbi:MAG: Maf family protein [Candidatus Binatia bacterium]